MRTPSLTSLLAVPYVLETSSVVDAHGRWVRRAEFVELSGCAAESSSIVEAIDAAERLRVRALLRMWVAGTAPPAPRPPIQGYDVVAEIDRMGLRAEYLDALDRRAATLLPTRMSPTHG